MKMKIQILNHRYNRDNDSYVEGFTVCFPCGELAFYPLYDSDSLTDCLDWIKDNYADIEHTYKNLFSEKE